MMWYYDERRKRRRSRKTHEQKRKTFCEHASVDAWTWEYVKKHLKVILAHSNTANSWTLKHILRKKERETNSIKFAFISVVFFYFPFISFSLSFSQTGRSQVDEIHTQKSRLWFQVLFRYFRSIMNLFFLNLWWHCFDDLLLFSFHYIFLFISYKWWLRSWMGSSSLLVQKGRNEFNSLDAH